MKTKADFFSLLDEWKIKGLPNGKRLGRESATEYVLQYMPNEFVGFYDKPMGKGGLDGWYGKWFRGETVEVKKKKLPENNLHFEPIVSQPVTDQEQIATDRKFRSIASQRDEYKRKYNALLNEIESVEKRFDALCAIKEKISIDPIIPSYKDSTSESIAIAQLSDVHVGENVDPATVNGMNEYNPDIADKRCYHYFQNLLTRINALRQDTVIETLFLSLTGDNITGYIHEELIQNNFLSPTEETRFAKRLLIRGIDFLLNHGKFKKIIIQTNWGNHGRNTKKSTHGAGWRNSYEWMMYCDIAEYYKNTSIIEFNLTKSRIAYSPPLFDKVIRTCHGDELSFGGGIGGLTVPLIKFLHRMDGQVYADMTLMGHWHTMFKIRKCLVNGSVIGFNGYAQSLGCEPEPPMQNLILLDKKRGFTIHVPVFCD